MTTPIAMLDRIVDALKLHHQRAECEKTWNATGTIYQDAVKTFLTDAPALRAALEEMEARLAALTAEPSEVVVGKVAAAIADARVKRVNPGVNIECLMTDNSKGDYDKAKAAIAAYRKAMGVI